MNPPAPTTTAPAPARRRLGGLLVRRERWGLSWRGRLLLLALAALLAWSGARGAHPFLAVTRRVPAGATSATNPAVLVVDGWMSIYSLRRAAEEFAGHPYDLVVVVRVPPETDEGRAAAAQWGDYMANILVQQGVPRERARTVFCAVARRDRTYHSALAVRDWLQAERLAPASVTVATAGPHARRSRLLYEQAFAGVPVGVVALEDAAYDPRAWWRSSEGVKEMVSEAAGYLYARFFFSPP